MISHATPANERLAALLPPHRVLRLRPLSGPTPLMRLAAFGHHIGLEVFMKRDDIGSTLALGGLPAIAATTNG